MCWIGVQKNGMNLLSVFEVKNDIEAMFAKCLPSIL